MLLPKLSVLVLACLLTACGFTSQHKPLRTTEHPTPSILINPIGDRSGQLLRALLEERIAQHGQPTYTLDVRLIEDVSYLGLQRDARASYGKLRLIAEYTLTRLSDGIRVHTHQLVMQHPYTIFPDEFASMSARESARDKGIRELADTVAQRVAQHFSKKQ